MLARADTQKVNLQMNGLFLVDGGRHQISQDRLNAPLSFCQS